MKYLYGKKKTYKNTYGAARENRTLMGKLPLGPQPSLSTNFSMAAFVYASDYVNDNFISSW